MVKNAKSICVAICFGSSNNLTNAVLLKVALPGSHYLIVFNMVITCCHFEFGSLWQYFLLIYSPQSVLIVMLLRRTLICHSPWQFF